MSSAKKKKRVFDAWVLYSSRLGYFVSMNDKRVITSSTLREAHVFDTRRQALEHPMHKLYWLTPFGAIAVKAIWSHN